MPVIKCDCFFITQLNMELNEISKKHIKVCKKHAELIFKNNEIKQDFKYNKKTGIYYNKNSSNENSLTPKEKINSSVSLYNSSSISSCDTDNSSSNSEVIEFGKYKGYTFDEVCNKYKNYCVNILNVKSKKKIDNEEMNKFIFYLKTKFKK